MFGTKRSENTSNTSSNVVQFISDRATLDRAKAIVQHYHEFAIGDDFTLFQDRGDKVTWHLKNGDAKKAITISREQLAGFVHVAIGELQRTEGEALELAREAEEREMAAAQAFESTPEPVSKRRGDPIKWGDIKSEKEKGAQDTSLAALVADDDNTEETEDNAS